MSEVTPVQNIIGFDDLSPTQKLVASMYKDEKGDPIILTERQDELFAAVAMKQFSRIHAMHHTRFGKSMTIGLAVLTRITTYPEKWAIISGTKDKAKIIMDYVIQHIFDCDYTRDKFVIEKGSSEDEVRRYRNKNRLTFSLGKDAEGKSLISELFIGTAAEAIGFGSPNIVADEASLIDDEDWSLVVRMLGDKLEGTFMIKIGNPFRRNHFLASYHDPKFKKMIVDCYQSLKDGRISQEIIDENRPYPFFKTLFECRFPSQTEVDESGWLYLLNDSDITIAQGRRVQEKGKRRLGVDVARGGRNYNVWVLRTDNTARVLMKNRMDDLVEIAKTTRGLARDNGVKNDEVYVDDTGVGGGVTDVLKNAQFPINAVRLGDSADNDPDCYNLRAEIYAGREGLMNWVKQGGALEPHMDWKELVLIRYRKNTGSKTQIESKEDMRKRGVESPDVADALALTFAKSKNTQYYGIDVQKVLSSGAPSEFGGVAPLIPGIG